jgi:hypothetical protein
MKTEYLGNTVLIEFDANDPISVVTLPAGYSYETIHVSEVTNLLAINQISDISKAVLTFPAVNSKSPCTISVSRSDPTKISRIRFSIEKFGQIPDIHYFDKAFDPILVVGDDGNKYNVIPSDQFK